MTNGIETGNMTSHEETKSGPDDALFGGTIEAVLALETIEDSVFIYGSHDGNGFYRSNFFE